MHPRLFQFGAVAIPASGVFTALAIVTALFMARIAARRLELNPEKIWDLGIVGVLTALIAPRLVLVLMNWSDFRAHPLWMLGLVGVRSPLALAIGMALAIGAMFAFAQFAALRWRRALDALAPAFALGYALFWVGAFIAGTNFGTPTNLPWAVSYSSRLASLWNRTPLGTPLHPVQLYAALAELCIFALLLTMIAKRDKWKISSGEVMGVYLFLHGLVTFFQNFLRGDFAPSVNSFPFAESFAAAMVLAGGLLWLL